MLTRLETLKAQVISHQCYVTYYDARIRSGVYKKRIVHKGINGPLMNTEELLDDELKTMLRHIHIINELIDSMNEMSAE